MKSYKASDYMLEHNFYSDTHFPSYYIDRRTVRYFISVLFILELL